MDKLDAKRRSENMRRIRSKDSKPELKVRQLVHGMGYRYRLHGKGLPGKPDMVFASRRKIIFVNGCFFHQHEGCADGRIPKSRLDYWKPKLTRNVERDSQNFRDLQALSWEVMIVWECETKDGDLLAKRIQEFLG